MTERKFRHTNIGDRFASLSRGNEARLVQVISAEEAESIGRQLAEDIVILDKPQGTFFERLKDDLSRVIKPVGGKVAVPATVAVLAVAAACGSGEKEKTDFAENLPVELFDACREYALSETVGDSHDQTGFALSIQYFQEHPNDDKALYLASSGALFLAGFEEAYIGFKTVQEGELPHEQQEIAREIVDGMEIFFASEGETLGDAEQLDEILNALFEPMGKIRQDLEDNICPDSAERPVDTDDEPSAESRYAYRDLLDNLLTDGGSSYSIPIASQLENYDYQHIADVQEVTQAIKNDVLTLDEANSLQTEFLINYAIIIPAKYMSENQDLGVVTDALNGAQVLLDILQDENYPLITYQLAPSGIRDKLIYFLGDEQGEEIFNELGSVILANLDTAQGQQLWNRLTVEDRILIEP